MEWTLRHAGRTRILISILSFSPIFLFCNFSGCKLKKQAQSQPATTGSCVLTVTGFMANCHNPSNSSNTINYTAEVTVYYRKNNQVWDLSHSGTITSNPSANPRNTFTTTLTIPTDGTPYWFSALIKGTECATCALTGQNCLQVRSPTNDGWIAGIPSGLSESPALNGARTSYTLAGNNYQQRMNISCGCEVKDHP